jgi:predicted PurR-regulated permease PerM
MSGGTILLLVQTGRRSDMTEIRHDLTRTTLAVLSIVALIAASLWILRPFIGAAIWATMIVVATWPLMLRVQARLWKKRGLAVAVMTLALLLILIVPLALTISAIVERSDQIVGWIRSSETFRMPPPPAWLVGLPLVGAKLAQVWEHVASSGLHDLAAKASPYAGAATRWFAAEVGSVGLVLVQLMLTVAIAAILYAGGEGAAAGALRFGRRLAGARGEHVVRLAAQAIRGVALGVVLTALAQALLGGIGLAAAGVPFAAVLTGVMFMLCIAQVGALPVLAPAVVWLFWSGDSIMATVLLVCSVVVVTMDNVLRPMLIRMGADLPLLLIFAGVIGGLLSLGLIGIFVGPVVLAVGYTLLDAWLIEDKELSDPTPPG